MRVINLDSLVSKAVPFPSGVTGNGGVVELGVERLIRSNHRIKKSVEGKFGRVKYLNLRLRRR